MTQLIRLTDEEIEIVRQSLKALEPTFCQGYPPFQASLMKSSFYRLLYKFNPPNQSKKEQKQKRQLKPRAIEPLIMQQVCNPLEILFDKAIRNPELIEISPFVYKVLNPCAGTNQGALSHFLKRRSDLTIILNEEDNVRLSIPIDSDFSPAIETEWEAWASKGYLEDWVIFEPPNNEGAIKIMDLAIGQCKKLAILCPMELLLPMSPFSIFLEDSGLKPKAEIVIDGSTWFHDSVWLVFC